MSEAVFPALKSEFPSVSLEAQTQCIVVRACDLKKICLFLKGKLDFDYLMNLTAIDYKSNFALVYIFYSFQSKTTAYLKIFLDKNNPSVESIACIYRAADWHEREAYDLMGINFTGHPDLRRILLPDDWQGHPLRKDYERDGMIRMPQ